MHKENPGNTTRNANLLISKHAEGVTIMYEIECSDPEEMRKLIELVAGKDAKLVIRTDNAYFVAALKRHYKNLRIRKIEEKS